MDADQIKRVYNRAYEVAFAENPSGFAKQDCILAGVLAVAEWARKQTLEEAETAIVGVFPYNCELNPDGTEDRVTAAWVEGGHDALAAIRALGTPPTQEETP